MRHYISYEEFYVKLVNMQVHDTWRLKCEDNDNPNDDNCIYTLVFTKYQYEAENGQMYPFIVYSYPKTLDAGLIQEDIDHGWRNGIIEVWNDITEMCNLKPFIEQ